MAPDAPDVRTLEVRGWLLRASEDLRAGRHDLTAMPPLVNDVVFHAQQCVEKAMKAYLVHREQTFRKTHNLTELGGAVARLEPTWTELMKHASLLTEFAWRFRYPGEPATVSRQDAEQAIALAGKVLDEVMYRLPSNCRPA